MDYWREIIFLFAILSKMVASFGQRPTIRLCCNPHEILDTTSSECRTIPQDFNSSSWTVTNFWSDGISSAVNILNDTDYKVEKVTCRVSSLRKYFEYSVSSKYELEVVI